MEVKEKYRTIEVSGKRIVSTDWKQKFLVEDDFNEKDFDWDKFFNVGLQGLHHVEPRTYDEKTYTGEITDVVEGEEYSETSSHDISAAPNNGISFGGLRTTLLDDCGMKLFHHKKKVSSQLNDAPDTSTTS